MLREFLRVCLEERDCSKNFRV
uniref:Uncharacterized protein n=1 Tax=Arundo donax TaxID=35708 RepID=A0A0A9AHI4_ARUDO